MLHRLEEGWQRALRNLEEIWLKSHCLITICNSTKKSNLLMGLIVKQGVNSLSRVIPEKVAFVWWDLRL